MPASDVPSLGERIREVRVRRGISLRALARDVGVSASMISQIETGKSRPSVSTLYAITNALGMSVQDVFEVAPAQPPVGSGLPVTVLEALGAARGTRLGPLVRPAQRQVLTLDSGVTWERLGELPPLHVDFLLVTYAPGGSSSSTGDLMRHPGWEYGYLISGALALTLGFEEMSLRPGDAISFDSTTPHRYRNDGTEPAVGVWLVIEDR
ncbi:MAG TPA: cupin domain-containing protein [Micromonosporaceae bacterium]|jgi:transcriptional regulator with XRE-family HTH domain|nr:cupin domain-containing protein [Micromonosporaceae bacterium]